MTPDSAATPTAPRPSRSRWIAALVLLVGIGIGAVATVVITGRDASPATDSPASRLAGVQASCRAWMSSTRGQAEVDGQWCTDMFAWMGEQTDGSMNGSMMWRGPEQMGAACRRWVGQEPTAGAALDQRRCTEMVEWMDGHLSGSRGSWMMHGS